MRGRLADLLRMKRLSQASLASDLGVSQANVSRWLKGSIPESKSTMALAKRLEVSMEWLLFGVGPEPLPVDAFIIELRKYRIPRLDWIINRATTNRDMVTKNQPGYLEGLEALRRSLTELLEHAEAKREINAPPVLEYPSRFRLRDNVRVVREDGAIEYLADAQNMVCAMLNLPAGAPLDEVRAKFRKFMAKKAKNIRPSRSKVK